MNLTTCSTTLSAIPARKVRVGVRVSFEGTIGLAWKTLGRHTEPRAPRVYVRFYRVSETCRRRVRLGLALVENNAQQHGAKVTLASGATAEGARALS